MGARLVGHPVAIGIPERPLLENHDPPAGAREALCKRDAAGARTDDQHVDLLVRGVAPHALEVLQPATVRVQQPRGIVLGGHPRGALDEAAEAVHDGGCSGLWLTGSSS